MFRLLFDVVLLNFITKRTEAYFQEFCSPYF
jgi:hypothetical protein